MENTEKQEEVIQEVETQDQPVEEQKPVEEKISYKEVKKDGTIKIDLSKLKKISRTK